MHACACPICTAKWICLYTPDRMCKTHNILEAIHVCRRIYNERYQKNITVYEHGHALAIPLKLKYFVVLNTVRVARKVASHTVTFSFLIQSYLSTVLLFAGLYTLSTKFEVSKQTCI